MCSSQVSSGNQRTEWKVSVKKFKEWVSLHLLRQAVKGGCCLKETLGSHRHRATKRWINNEKKKRKENLKNISEGINYVSHPRFPFRDPYFQMLFQLPLDLPLHLPSPCLLHLFSVLLHPALAVRMTELYPSCHQKGKGRQHRGGLRGMVVAVERRYQPSLPPQWPAVTRERERSIRHTRFISFTVGCQWLHSPRLPPHSDTRHSAWRMRWNGEATVAEMLLAPPHTRW